nr:MAG TPA: hypothetical protein [Caudoviricetes sp.]
MRLSFCCACVESGPFTLPSGRDFFACIPLNASLTGLEGRLKRFNGVFKCYAINLFWR